MPCSGIAGSYGSPIFSFVRTCQTIFQSVWTILHSHQQCMRVPVTPHPCQHLVLSVFKILVIQIGVFWYLIFVLICISLMTYDVEHLFLCLFVICISSLVRFLLGSLAHFQSFKSSLYILENRPLSDVPFPNIISQSVACLLILLTLFFAEQRFQFNEV